MATERSLKAYSQQKMGSFKESHDLFVLFDEVSEHLCGVPRAILKRIPRVNQVMDDRYGLDGTLSLGEIVNTYHAVISLVSQISFLFRRELDLGGVGFLLKRPPWTSLPIGTPATIPLRKHDDSCRLRRRTRRLSHFCASAGLRDGRVHWFTASRQRNSSRRSEA
jgi:hypothetical protein